MGKDDWEPNFREWLKGQRVDRTSQNHYYHAAKAAVARGITHEDEVNWKFPEKSETYRKDLRRGIRKWTNYNQEMFGGVVSTISSTTPDISMNGGPRCSQ